MDSYMEDFITTALSQGSNEAYTSFSDARSQGEKSDLWSQNNDNFDPLSSSVSE